VYDLNGLGRPEWNTLSPNNGPTGDPRWDAYVTGSPQDAADASQLEIVTNGYGCGQNVHELKICFSLFTASFSSPGSFMKTVSSMP
jgi:hypothetical protein